MVSNDPEVLMVGEQVNKVSSFLDHSGIYGGSHEILEGLREFQGGRMKIEENKDLDPKSSNFADSRANQTPMLRHIYQIFVKFHNKVAFDLRALNPHWDDERTFQEVRRINIAVYQNILYSEWLPLFLGKKYCKTHRLTLECEKGESCEEFRWVNQRLKRFKNNFNKKPLFSSTSSDSIDASTLNEFSASAFRTFHGFIGSQVNFLDENYKTVKVSNLSDVLGSKMFEKNFSEILRGGLETSIGLEGYSGEVSA